MIIITPKQLLYSSKYADNGVVINNNDDKNRNKFCKLYANLLIICLLTIFIL